MARRLIKESLAAVAVILLAALPGCGSVDDDRIPAMAVSVNISGMGMWNTYGVSGYGQSRRFILSSTRREPTGFPYTQTSSTGFGGILLISGIDPFSGDSSPLAYDLACPVECRRDVRVNMVEAEGHPFPVAQCPVCKSEYDVFEAGGRPISGKAEADGYGLRIYYCVPPANGMGGYIVTNQ